jgi:antitoxin (DNA-binding transcriptional repressor) of toxin-antitoxin stability system
MKDLKERTPSVIEAAQDVDVIITLHGKPKAILRRFSEDDLGELISTSVPIRKKLAEAIEHVRTGRTMPASGARSRGAAGSP